MTSLGNDRIYSICQGVFFGAGGSGAPTFLKGVQAVGINRNVSPEFLSDAGRMNQTFLRYGKTAYEITVTRILDVDDNTFYTSPTENYDSGHLLANTGAIGPGGPGTPVTEYDIKISYGEDDKVALGNSGSYSSQLFTYCVLTNISYTFSAEGAVTENLTFLGQRYEQGTDGGGPTDIALDEGFSMRRQDLDIGLPATNSVFPKEVEEAFQDGAKNESGVSVSSYGLTSIDISCDISYRDIPDYGKWDGSDTPSQSNRFKLVELPVSITATFNGWIKTHYFISSLQDHEVTDTYHTSLPYGSEVKGVNNYFSDRQIRIVTKKIERKDQDGNVINSNPQYWIWDLGSRNYMADFSVSGGDVGGQIVEASMTFVNDCSDFFVYQKTNTPLPTWTPSGKV